MENCFTYSIFYLQNIKISPICFLSPDGPDGPVGWNDYLGFLNDTWVPCNILPNEKDHSNFDFTAISLAAINKWLQLPIQYAMELRESALKLAHLSRPRKHIDSQFHHELVQSPD